MSHARRGGGSTVAASIAAIGSMLLGLSCCLPVLPFTIAAGLAGGSAFLGEARPYLLVLSLLSLGYGFYRFRRAKQCQERPSRIVGVLLWTSLGVVTVSLLFPQLMANVIASLAAR